MEAGFARQLATVVVLGEAYVIADPDARMAAAMADARRPAATLPSPPAAPVAAETDRIDPRRLVAFLAMVFGMFMAILDIQIVSASLTEIQSGLAASAYEIPAGRLTVEPRPVAWRARL